ncbi:MAG: type II toxin-antitoxin system RelE/ParE family toxin [Phycisphaerales bacterium]|nr:type II toxin-antitoxin system RelE/ParE family toxin [Phycisphaerales bacterium]
MAFRVQVTPRAQADVRAIHNYLLGESPQAALGFIEGTRRVVADLCYFPRRHPLIPERVLRDREIRHALCWGYRVIFEIREDTCDVLTIRHAARRPVGRDDLGTASASDHPDVAAE